MKDISLFVWLQAKSDVKTQTKQGTTALGKSASGMDVSAAKKGLYTRVLVYTLISPVRAPGL